MTVDADDVFGASAQVTCGIIFSASMTTSLSNAASGSLGSWRHAATARVHISPFGA